MVAISINDDITLHFKTAAKSQRMSSTEFEYGFKSTFCASSPFFSTFYQIFNMCSASSISKPSSGGSEPVNAAHSEMHENGTRVSHTDFDYFYFSHKLEYGTILNKFKNTLHTSLPSSD